MKVHPFKGYATILMITFVTIIWKEIPCSLGKNILKFRGKNHGRSARLMLIIEDFSMENGHNLLVCPIELSKVLKDRCLIKSAVGYVETCDLGWCSAPFETR
jgi:hypothetical protein